jgi:uncharacterized protein (TIGR02646 family)
MIRLSKRPEPQVLLDHAVEWTEALLDREAAGENPTAYEKTRYRHPEIKATLIAETFGKCAYCESRLLHIHHGDVEHIYPKSLDVLQSFDWENLTLACEICNQNKSNRDPLVEHIIDPYAEDPEAHLVFLGSLIFPKSPKGTATRAILELHRAALVEMREEQLGRVMGVYVQVLREDLPLVARQAIYAELVQHETAARAQFAAMNRGVVSQMLAALPVGVA